MLKFFTESNLFLAEEVLAVLKGKLDKLQWKNKDIVTYEESIDSEIVGLIARFMDGSTLKKGRDITSVTEVKNVIFQACTSFAEEERRIDIAKRIGLGYKYCYQKDCNPDGILDYKQTATKKRESTLAQLQHQCIVDFCHSDEGSYVDSNFNKVTMVKK